MTIVETRFDDYRLIDDRFGTLDSTSSPSLITRSARLVILGCILTPSLSDVSKLQRALSFSNYHYAIGYFFV